MSFFWNGYILHDFLFKSFDSKSVPGFLGILIALFSAGILYEGMYFLKKSLFQKFLDIRKIFQNERHRSGRRTFVDSDIIYDNEVRDVNPRNSLISENNRPPESDSGSRRTSRFLASPNIEFVYLFLSSIIHACYAFVGFTLMNAVMTFNIWILLAVCLGVGVGYLVFGTIQISGFSDNDTTSGDTDGFQTRCSIEAEIETDPGTPESENNKTDIISTGSKNTSPVLSKTRSQAPSSKSNESQEQGQSQQGVNVPSVSQKNLSRKEEKSSPTPTPHVIVVGAEVHNHFQKST